MSSKILTGPRHIFQITQLAAYFCLAFPTFPSFSRTHELSAVADQPSVLRKAPPFT